MSGGETDLIDRLHLDCFTQAIIMKQPLRTCVVMYYRIILGLQADGRLPKNLSCSRCNKGQQVKTTCVRDDLANMLHMLYSRHTYTKNTVSN